MRFLLVILLAPFIVPFYFKDGELVNVWIKYLSPRNNAQETYRYDRYLCIGDSSSLSSSTLEYPKTLADALLGIEPVSLGLDLKFGRNNSSPIEYCQIKDREEVIRDLVKDHYVLRGSIDGIDFILDVGSVDSNGVAHSKGSLKDSQS